MEIRFFRFLMRSEIGDSIKKMYGAPALDRMDFYDKWLRNVATDEQVKIIAEQYARYQIEKEET